MSRTFIALILLASATVFVALRTAENPEMYVLPDEYLSEYVSTFDGEVLIEEFNSKFPKTIENVFRVDLHYRAEGDYPYYVAYGEFENESTALMIKASENDVQNQSLGAAQDCDPEPYCIEVGINCVCPPGFGIKCGCCLSTGCYIW